MMDQQVALFAMARERAGRSTVDVRLESGATVLDLKRELASAVPELADLIPHCHISIDQAYATDDQTIPTGAEVACIPPVSGG